MKSEEKAEFLEAAKAKYLERIGYPDNRIGRQRPLVEMRAAFMNAAYPYASRVECAGAWDKDHTTAIHADRQHGTYMRFSPNYRRKYLEALKVFESISEDFLLHPRYEHSRKNTSGGCYSGKIPFMASDESIGKIEESIEEISFEEEEEK